MNDTDIKIDVTEMYEQKRQERLALTNKLEALNIKAAKLKKELSLVEIEIGGLLTEYDNIRDDEYHLSKYINNN